MNTPVIIAPNPDAWSAQIDCALQAIERMRHQWVMAANSDRVDLTPACLKPTTRCRCGAPAEISTAGQGFCMAHRADCYRAAGWGGRAAA
jgi:hypothetical protein